MMPARHGKASEHSPTGRTGVASARGLRALSLVLVVLLALLGARQLSAAGPTYVSGAIATSTNWTTTGSPYVITGDVTVLPGATLTIRPGVQVRFNATDASNAGSYPTKTELIIRGRLDAAGTAAQPILITSNGLTIGATWGEIAIHSNDNTIAYADIRYATYGVQFYGTAGSPVSNNRILSTQFFRCGDDTLVDDALVCAGGGVDEVGGAIRGAYVDSSTFLQNEIHASERGIWLESSDHNVIRENTIYDLQQTGIRLSGDSSHNLVRANSVRGIASYGLELIGGAGNQGVGNVVNFNSIHDTWDVGLVLGYQNTADAHENVLYRTAYNPDNRNCNGAGYDLNLVSGILLDATSDSNLTANRVYENGNAKWGIAAHGVDIQGGSTDNVLAENSIYNHPGDGVVVVGASTDRNTLTENVIYGNAGIGIDLGDDGVTPNDVGDLDAGPNEGLNYPEIVDVAYLGGTRYTVQGTSAAGATVELFATDLDKAGYGEASSFITRTTATIAGVWGMTFDLADAIMGSPTATDASGNTSEFGKNKVVAGHVWVDDDWVGRRLGDVVDTKIYGVNGFATIQEAVNTVAISGTVHIRAGIYREQVVIEKSGITLEGESSSLVILRGNGLSSYSTILTSGIQNAAIAINPDKVEAGHPLGISLRNMTIERADAAIYMPKYAEGVIIDSCVIQRSLFGVLAEQDARDLTITNNTFQDNEYSISIGSHYSNRFPYTHAYNVVISSNRILDGDHQIDLQGEMVGILVWEADCVSPTSGIEIYNNEVRDQSYGIYLAGVHDATIQENLIEDIPYRITESHFTENGYGILLYSWSGLGNCAAALTQNVDVLTNTIRTSYKGLVSLGARDVWVQGNSILENANDGVEIGPSTNQKIRWPIAPATIYAYNNELHGNAICGNGAYQLDNLQPAAVSGVLPATCNWWGTNTPASGAEINSAANVAYSPWIVMSLTPQPPAVSDSGTSTSLIYAEYSECNGYSIPNGHEVLFDSSGGELDPRLNTTLNGQTWTELLANVTGTIVVTATDQCGQVMVATVDAVGYEPDAEFIEHNMTVEANSDETFRFVEYEGQADTAVVTITFPFRFDFNMGLPAGAVVGSGSVEMENPATTCPLSLVVSDVLSREVPIGSNEWITYTAHWVMDSPDGCSVLPDRDIWITGTKDIGWTFLVEYPPDGDYVMPTTVTTTLTISGTAGGRVVVTNPSCATYYPIGIFFRSELNQILCRSTGVDKAPTPVWLMERYPVGPSFQRGIIETTLPEPFVAWVHDSSRCNNGIADVPIQWDIILAPEGATGQKITAHHFYTDATGRALAWLTLGNKTGQYVIRAWSPQARGEAIFSAQATAEGCTVTLISYGIDDTWVSDDEGNHRETTYLRIGDGRYDVGLRFREPGVPQGSLVSSAVIRFSPAISSTAPVTVTIYGEPTDYAEPFLASTELVPFRPRTNASVTWVIDCLHWKSWIRPVSPNIAPIIQEIVDRPGWLYHNALALFLIADPRDRGNGYRDVYSYEGAMAEEAPWSAPELEICFIPPWAITPSPTPTVTETPWNTPTPTRTPKLDASPTPTPTVTGTPTKRYTATATTTPVTATPSLTRVPTWTPTVPVTGEIRGLVWEDANEDGDRDLGEPAIAGVQITLRDQQAQPITSASTGPDGVYAFPNLPPAIYIVQEVDLPGYYSTTPNSAQVQVLGNDIIWVDFGDKRQDNSIVQSGIYLPAILKQD